MDIRVLVSSDSVHVICYQHVQDEEVIKVQAKTSKKHPRSTAEESSDDDESESEEEQPPKKKLKRTGKDVFPDQKAVSSHVAHIHVFRFSMHAIINVMTLNKGQF